MRSRRQILRVGAGLACSVIAPRGLARDPRPDWASRARTVMDAIQKDLADPKSGGYVQSTDKHEPEFMWGNGVLCSALVAAARHDRAKDGPLLSRFFASLDRSWDKKAKVPGYEPAPIRGDSAPHDKYYDDNQWMVITFMEAYELTREPRYLARAQEALRFSLSGWDDALGGGIWWHEGHKDGTKNTCSNAPAAVACLRVARRHDAKSNLDWARRLTAWTREHLQDQDGLFFDRVKVEDGRIIKGKLTYNAALMIRANLGLFRATKEEAFLAEAKRISGACTHFIRPETGGYRDALKFSHLLVEADLELARTTKDDTSLDRARKTAEAAWQAWEKSPPKELIERAALARMLWLLADAETDTGRAFWQAADTDRP